MADRVQFVVEYEDGRHALMWIDRWTLNQGDHVAPIVAREKQEAGEIPEGKIESVKRAR